MDSTLEHQAKYDLLNFTIRDMTECGRALRDTGVGLKSMEETATRIVRRLYDSLINGQTGERACALVRLFKTHSYEALDDTLQVLARCMLGRVSPAPDMKNLVLLATVGDNPVWNSRSTSQGHKIIPLPSVEAIHEIPMIRTLINQLGLEVNMLVKPDREYLLDMEQRSYNVFHIPEATGNLIIPSQSEFVIPLGIKSVVGFGGVLPTGDVFAVIMFSKVPISAEVADLFRNISLNIKIALMPFQNDVFAQAEQQKCPSDNSSISDVLRTARINALEQLLDVHEHTVIKQADKVYEEINERKRTEEELSFKNAMLSTQQETSIDGILVVDESDNVISFNRRFADLWEIPPELVEAGDDAPVLQSVAEKVVDPKGFVALIKQIYENKEEKYREEIFLKDGRIIDRYTAPMRGSDGKYYGRVWYFRDITERKRLEDTMRESENVLRKIFDSIPDLLSIIDRDLRIVRSNWQGGYEYVDEAIRGCSPYCYDAYYPGQGKACEDCHALKVFRTGRPVTSEKYNPRIGLVEVRAFPIFDDSGEVVMVAEYIRDLTEQKKLEEDLRRAHKLDSLGVLAGGIAHDFNNLLTGILGNVSMTKLGMNPENKCYAGLDKAEKAIKRASDLTQQLLTFSKGGAPIRKTASIEQIVIDSASFVLRGSNVRCEFIFPDAVWTVEVDEGQMNQVINNLIINADQSMPEGGIIKVRIENLAVGPDGMTMVKEGRYVRISIEDHGTGISEDHLHKIFDPYFTTKQKGSGLGLATVYSIIKSHDGNIGFESKVGTGTTFHVYLPASDKGMPAVIRTEEKPLSGSGKILIMDDEELVREVASGILDHFGYEAAVCSDGNEAIELYREAKQAGEPFAAVIMDLTIPGGMGGKETMKMLLDIDRKAVGIVSSGYCNDPILAHYRDYGFRGVVTKPYSIEELSKVLYDLLPLS
jgi:signal transduction histidine kinase